MARPGRHTHREIGVLGEAGDSRRVTRWRCGSAALCCVWRQRGSQHLRFSLVSQRGQGLGTSHLYTCSACSRQGVGMLGCGVGEGQTQKPCALQLPLCSPPRMEDQFAALHENPDM